jgi:RNA polymerase sigma factor (sigma-70 family)
MDPKKIAEIEACLGEIRKHLSEIRKQNLKAVETLFELLYSPLYEKVVKVMRNKQTSQDIVQDAFSTLLNNGLSPFENFDAVEKSLVATCRDLCLNYAKDQRTEIAIKNELTYLSDKEQASIESEKMKAEYSKALLQAYSKLSPQRKEIFKRVSRGASSDEIAADLNIKNKSIHTINYITIKRLKKSIQ